MDDPQRTSDILLPERKRRGVSVETSDGKALTFGVSKDRTKRMLADMAARKYNEVTRAMHEQKAARLGSKAK